MFAGYLSGKWGDVEMRVYLSRAVCFVVAVVALSWEPVSSENRIGVPSSKNVAGELR